MELQWRHPILSRRVRTHQILVLHLHHLFSLQLYVMNTTLAQLEPHVVAFLSMETSALLGDAALLSLQLAATTVPAVALMTTRSAMLKLELADW